MKVLIQDVRTDRYVAQGRSFTSRASEARDFLFSRYACAVARREKILNLRVVYYFEEFDYIIQARGGQEAGFHFGAADLELAGAWT